MVNEEQVVAGLRRLAAAHKLELLEHDKTPPSLQAALDTEPNRHKARFELGLVELQQGHNREAAAAFEEVVRQRPKDRAALQNLLKARTAAGDHAAALEAAGRMHAAYPKDAPTLLTMAALLQSMDRDDEATALMTDACAKGMQEACQ